MIYQKFYIREQRHSYKKKIVTNSILHDVDNKAYICLNLSKIPSCCCVLWTRNCQNCLKFCNLDLKIDVKCLRLVQWSDSLFKQKIIAHCLRFSIILLHAWKLYYYVWINYPQGKIACFTKEFGPSF